MKKEAVFYKKLENNKVQCTLCPHNCVINENSFGICKVRKNIDGVLYAKSYGLASALALDPIEKKPFYNFFPGTTILSMGSLGCNMKCQFCQNHHISQIGIEAKSLVKLEFLTSEQLVEMAISLKDKKNIGLAFTYNEPFVNFEFMLDTAKLLKKENLKTTIVTNGFVSKEALDMLLPYIDAMNIDLKAFNERFYKKLCSAKLNPVKDNIKTIFENYKNVHLEITSLIIPGYNDCPNEMKSLSEFLSSMDKNIPLHINRHHPAWKLKEPMPISKEKLYDLANIARGNLKNVYVGNI